MLIVEAKVCKISEKLDKKKVVCEDGEHTLTILWKTFRQ